MLLWRLRHLKHWHLFNEDFVPAASPVFGQGSRTSRKGANAVIDAHVTVIRNPAPMQARCQSFGPPFKAYLLCFKGWTCVEVHRGTADISAQGACMSDRQKWTFCLLCCVRTLFMLSVKYRLGLSGKCATALCSTDLRSWIGVQGCEWC
eukprot:5720167-Amphidinium_carterae.1